MDNQAENALQDVRNEIQKAIENNDARAVDFYNTLLQFIECNEIIKLLKTLNVSELRNIISYFENKMTYLTSKLATFDNVLYYLNEN